MKQHQTIQFVLDVLFKGDGADYPLTEAKRKQTPIIFDTSDRGGLHLLSCYIDDSGIVHVDIGEDGE